MTRYTARWAILFVLLCCPMVLSETYHIDPENGADDGDGSAAKPWKTLEQAAKKHFGKLKGGDTVLLASGFHGAATFAGDNESTVTIAADKGAKPKLHSLNIRSGSNWLVKGLLISPSFGEGGEAGRNIVTFGENGDSSKIALEDCYVFGVEDSSSWGAKEWMDAPSGILVGRNGKDLTVRNCYIRNVRFGISMTAFDSLAEGNVIENFSADGIRVTRDGQTAQYNVIRNAYVSDADGDKNHDDGIQCFLFNKGKGEVKNITIVGNVVIAHDSPNQKLKNAMQGIGFFDGPLTDFKVTDNVVYVETYHGISLYDAQNAVVERNVVWTPGAGKVQGWIMFGTKSKDEVLTRNNTARNNFANKYNLKAPGTTADKNEKATEEIYDKALKQAIKTINDKFGETHPTAEKPRLAK
jgi:preprotein translocase subunit YajC